MWKQTCRSDSLFSTLSRLRGRWRRESRSADGRVVGRHGQAAGLGQPRLRPLCPQRRRHHAQLHQPPPNPTSSTCSSHASASTTTAGRQQQTLPQISVYGGLPDRHTVQVIQQALHRQPSTAAQYLQQMYAAQQQHLMLQTAALQQQHLSLAAVQQASIVAGRQNCSQNGITSQQAVSSQTTIKLAGSPVAAQLMGRAQAASSSPGSITQQQAVLLGHSSTPTLTASQAQMYLRAQMLILTPTATVTTIQPDAPSQPVSQQAVNAQMQNLILRGQQGAVASSPSQAQLQGLCMKQCAGGVAELVLQGQTGPQLKSPDPGCGSQVLSALLGHTGAAAKASPADTASQPVKMSHSSSGTCPHVSHSALQPQNTHPLVNTAYTQIQTHQLLQHKQHFLIQQQSQLSQRSQGQVFQAGPVPPSPQAQAQAQAHIAQAVALQPALSSQQCAVPALPKPPASCQQAAIFHSSVNPQAHNGQSSSQNPTKARQLQISATGLTLQPPPSQTAVATQDDADKDNVPHPAARENCSAPGEEQLLLTEEPANTEQYLSDHSLLTRSSEGAECVDATAGVCVPAAMTSGTGNNTPTVTGSTPQNGQSKTPQAVVKPQILTHVIEGFVIQEGAEPFPVERPSLLIENLKKQKLQQQSYSELEKRAVNSHTADSEMEDLSQDLKSQQKEPTLSCELCGKVDFAYNFKRSKRFCSTVCAKRYNVGCTKRIGLFPRRPSPENPKKQKASSNNHQNTSSEARKTPAGSACSTHLSSLSHGESTQCSDMSSYEEPPSPLSVASSGVQRPRRERGARGQQELPLLARPFLPNEPAQWKVDDVYEFICSLPGCQEIADEFRAQEIDGQALLLLKEDHLMSTMNIKLGPALKIFARISMLKDS
ncbi:LOW QUALITY PROTEIN: polyhomeotic-like protein 2 [Brachyhypopomus gauderio]|uniref:LOW QUALITY PROTEIN: polyhomeotic-like protein 2 n=1 Tax=Brachyhypopomus gauderio TaxID=698409 RepID=UPI004042AB36